MTQILSIAISNPLIYFLTMESLKLEIWMLLNIWKTLLQLLKPELLIMLHLKCGANNLTIIRAIFGHWEQSFIKWQCRNLHSEPKLLINSTKKSWSENTKRYHLPIRNSFPNSLVYWWLIIRKKDLKLKNCFVIQKWLN